MNDLPKTLIKPVELAVKNGNPVASQTVSLKELKSDRLYLYSISDKLITDVGRFCECHNTDFMVSWDTMINDMKSDENDEGVYYFGIRDFGVDHNAYIFINIREHKYDVGYIAHYYRKLYAVRFKKNSEDNEMIVQLYKISSISYNTEDDNYVI